VPSAQISGQPGQPSRPSPRARCSPGASTPGSRCTCQLPPVPALYGRQESRRPKLYWHSNLSAVTPGRPGPAGLEVQRSPPAPLPYPTRCNHATERRSGRKPCFVCAGGFPVHWPLSLSSEVAGRKGTLRKLSGLLGVAIVKARDLRTSAHPNTYRISLLSTLLACGLPLCHCAL
jgi:hypothetical protein